MGLRKKRPEENRASDDEVAEELSDQEPSDRDRVVVAMKQAAWSWDPEEGLAEAVRRKAKARRLPVRDASERVIALPPLADLAQQADSGSKHPPTPHPASETSGPCSPRAPCSRPPLLGGAPSIRPTPTGSEGTQPAGGGGRLARPAGGPHRPGARTVALRWCSTCGRFLGIKLWPRTGDAVVHTHGLCHACFERMTDDALEGPALLGAQRVGSAGHEPAL